MTTKVARPHKAKVRPTDPRQGNLLAALLRDEGPALVPLPSDQLPSVRGFSEDQRVRRLIGDAIRVSGRSRDELAAAMSSGDEAVSAAMLHTWTGPSRSNCAPVKHLKAFLRAIGARAAFELLNELLAGSGFIVLDEQMAAFARLGQQVAMHAALGKNIQAEAAALAPGWARP